MTCYLLYGVQIQYVKVFGEEELETRGRRNGKNGGGRRNNRRRPIQPVPEEDPVRVTYHYIYRSPQTRTTSGLKYLNLLHTSYFYTTFILLLYFYYKTKKVSLKHLGTTT